jgi:hypothetical protein
MAVVATAHGVRENAGFEIIVVFPRKIKRRGHGFGDITGGTETLTYDIRVRLSQSTVCLVAGNPVSSLLANRITNGNTLLNPIENARK